MLLSPEKKYYVYRLGLSLASGASLASAFAPANTPLFALAALILIFYIVGVTEKVSHAVLWGMAFGFGWFVTGISWVYYSMYQLAGLAPFIGSFGVLLGLVWIAGLIGAIWALKGKWIYVAACGITIFSVLLLSMAGKQIVWSEPSGEMTVRLVQPNLLLQQSMSERFDEMYFYLDNVKVEKASVDAVILPESAYPLAWQQFPNDQKERLLQWVKSEKKSLLFNAFWLSDGQYSNAAIALDEKGDLSLYQKHHLVPFGEFVPWGFRWFIDAMRIPMTDLQPGNESQLAMNFAGHSVAVNLCYENLFGSEWIRAWDHASPELLINLSNLKWFGPVKAASQHLQISQMRALETARPLLSVTNSGETAYVDAHGVVVKRLATDIDATMDVTVTTMKGEATPYVKWGDWPAVILAFLMLIAAFICTFAEKRLQKG